MKTIVSPCGLNCSNCSVYKDNVTPELQEKIAQSTPFKKEDINCNGCTAGNPCISLKLQGKECLTLNCSIKKGVKYCFECNDFPCEHLMPTADGATIFPHNTKLYNLCMMKKIGIDKWVEISDDINTKYFTTKFEIGKGAAD